MEKTLPKLANALAETKFRIVSQGDLLCLKIINMADEPSASNIILHFTMAQGRMMALSQIGPILKSLQKTQLIASKEVKSGATGRPMMVYNLTAKGRKALELSEELVHLVGK
jgi:DNA-binding PadR family transcriptional regulator